MEIIIRHLYYFYTEVNTMCKFSKKTEKLGVKAIKYLIERGYSENEINSIFHEILHNTVMNQKNIRKE